VCSSDLAGSFLVGMVEAALSADKGTFELCLKSLDRWVTHAADRNPSAPEVEGTRDRNVPAWDHAWFLVNRLILILCLGYRTAPRQVFLHEGPGYVFKPDGEGTHHALPNGTVHERRLDASFALHGDPNHPRAGAGPARPDDGVNPQEDLPDRLLFSCRGEPLTAHPWISPHWWRIREGHAALGGALPC
jgi:hypothetical protein